jgi:hypothetical protein
MKKELKQFDVSRRGFDQLSEYNYDLMERARTIVLWCLETSYGKNAEHYLDAFQEGAIWCGFKGVIIKNGEIDFFQYIQSLENAYEIKLSYLDNLNLYNQTVININYLTL